VLWGHLVFAAAGIASMKAAFDRGDLDEAARQGALAGPVVVEQALASPDRATRLAAIAAASGVEDRAELLGALARAAAAPDRRTAIPAAFATRTIARELAHHDADDRAPDDLAPEDRVTWRATFAKLAADRERPIEIRVLALDTSSALAPDGAGLPVQTSLGDPDPALRAAALNDLAMPIADDLRAPLAKLVVSDPDPIVALTAGAVLCADLAADPPQPVLDALGDAGLAKLKTLVRTEGAPRAALNDAGRCLAASRVR